MNIRDLIRKKRDGAALCAEELRFFAAAAAAGSVPDYQLSALLMAMYLRGLNERETVDLTLAMAHSGDTADLSAVNGITADKHSTGGVGDKTTLIVAPVVAACGLKVAKMSGRGLGHTGGTVDKLEAIPGFQTALSADAFSSVVNETGLCVCGQSGNFCPADRSLYALRDVTETVDSLPLIAASIMSKKLAGGAQCIVLDVKCGSGAFMKTLPEARALARLMVRIGRRAGRKTAALITNMNTPLGCCVGNGVEVAEAVQVLSGGADPALKTVAFALCETLLLLAGAGEKETCRALVRSAVESGAAKQKLLEMVRAQGGDPAYILRPQKLFAAAHETVLEASETGFFAGADALAVGNASLLLGAGRQTKTDPVDPTAGIRFLKRPGDAVRAGEPLAQLFCQNGALLPAAKAALAHACSFGDAPPKKEPMIFETFFGDEEEHDV